MEKFGTFTEATVNTDTADRVELRSEREVVDRTVKLGRAAIILKPGGEVEVRSDFADGEPIDDGTSYDDEDRPLAWQDGAPCSQTDPEIFFPEKGGSTKEAKRICSTSCDVQDLCLQYALDHGEKFGIWGGLSERERRKLKRNRSNSSEERDVA